MMVRSEAWTISRTSSYLYRFYETKWLLCQKCFLRHRIIPMTSPGMAAANAFSSEPSPLGNTMLFNGLQGIFRTSGGISTSVRQVGRNGTLVQSDQQFEDPFHTCAFSRLRSSKIKFNTRLVTFIRVLRLPPPFASPN